MDKCTDTTHVSVDNSENCRCGHFSRATAQQDRKTLETLSALLHSASEPRQCINIAEGYIWNKLKMYDQAAKEAETE